MSRGGVRLRALFANFVLVVVGIGAGGLLSAVLWTMVLDASPRYMVPRLRSEVDLFRWWIYPRFFVRDGDRLVSNHPAMPYQEFAARKAPGTFRVFLTGGSQAMGDPYVHVWPERTQAQAISLRIEDRGGISTWLETYLQMLHPDRSVEVLNVATAGQNASTVAAEVAEIVRIGEPDLIIVLSGNNEWRGPEITAERFERTVEGLIRQYSADLEAIAVAAEAARVPVYVLTVPSNVRDWMPSLIGTPLRGFIREVAAKRNWERGMRALEESQTVDHAIYFYLRARARDEAGDTQGAYEDFVRARDRDAAFVRAISAFNDAVRRLNGNYVHSFDLEAAMRNHARDGVPGFDLFHDFCHMKLRGYMLAAKEIALFHRDLHQLPELDLPDLDIPDQIRQSLRVLYAVKTQKWSDLAAMPAAVRLGEMNVENVHQQFEAEQRELDDLHRAIQLYEGDLEDAVGDRIPTELAQPACDGPASGVDCGVTPN